jgi:hypothetical protein
MSPPFNTTPRMFYIIFTLTLFLAEGQMAKPKNTQTQQMAFNTGEKMDRYNFTLYSLLQISNFFSICGLY